MLSTFEQNDLVQSTTSTTYDARTRFFCLHLFYVWEKFAVTLPSYDGTTMDEFWCAPIDLVTLVLILLGGIELGMLGIANVSLVGWAFGSWKSTVYIAIGIATVWQILRQRLTD